MIGLVLVGVGVVLGGVLVELESGRDELPALDAAPVEPAEPEPSVADVAPANPGLTSPPVGGSIGAATSRTELSERARELVPRMKIPGAIFILGPPSWAVTRADMEWSEPSAALTLLWANGACTPVTVHFNAAGEVISWDRGDALCFADEYQLVPGEEFSCSRRIAFHCVASRRRVLSVFRVWAGRARILYGIVAEPARNDAAFHDCSKW